MSRRGLVEFLLARIADVDDSEHPVACGPWQQGTHPPFAHHIARWDPERVRAECAVKRQVVRHERERSTTAVLRYLAAVYAGHQDYRDEWLPG